MAADEHGDSDPSEIATLTMVVKRPVPRSLPNLAFELDDDLEGLEQPRVELIGNVEHALAEPIPLSEALVLIARLEAGGHAGVYFVGKQRETGTKHLVRVFDDPRAREPAVRARVLEILRELTTIEHRNLARVEGFGVSEAGDPFLVLEYLRGETLASKLERDGSLDLRTALRLTIEICAALQQAHAAGLAHRDIEPLNLLLCSHEGVLSVKLLELGIERVMDEIDGGGVETERHETPRYMSPEQCTGRPVGPASDVYSTAVILYEMLVGAPPVDGASVIEVTKRRAARSHPPLAGPGSPPIYAALDAVLDKALASASQDRYAEPLEFARALVEAPRSKPASEGKMSAPTAASSSPSSPAAGPTSGAGAGAPASARVAELEHEVVQLRHELRVRTSVLAIASVLLVAAVIALVLQTLG